MLCEHHQVHTRVQLKAQFFMCYNYTAHVRLSTGFICVKTSIAICLWGVRPKRGHFTPLVTPSAYNTRAYSGHVHVTIMSIIVTDEDMLNFKV